MKFKFDEYGTDEIILEENLLPPWMELDTIYFFPIDEKIPENENIPMKDCLEIIEKDMSKSKDKGFTLKVNLGEKIVSLMCETNDERKMFIFYY